MSIEFHCEHCGKLVRAPDDGGGKHGKCPSCHQSIYIPMPSDEIEPLELEPVDQSEERERARLRQESLEIERQLLDERELPKGMVSETRPARAEAPLPPRIDMETLLIEYARAMAAGNLEKAEQYASDIRSDMRAAEEVIQRMVADEIPPDELAKIPRPVLVGFFRQLSEKK
jgi:hypothetical protein